MLIVLTNNTVLSRTKYRNSISCWEQSVQVRSWRKCRGRGYLRQANLQLLRYVTSAIHSSITNRIACVHGRREHAVTTGNTAGEGADFGKKTHPGNSSKSRRLECKIRKLR